ncbi:MAG: hypothetical protein JWQ35_1533 [Bacteriovoracaceae bacterium]|nr:hypothetical protein [Bacteriovoracaceae bacterium]
MLFGLSDKTIDQIRKVFSADKKVLRVRIFGSRALGTHREGSDIDLAIEGMRLNLEDILETRVNLEKLSLPYRFDLLDFSKINEPDLIDHIERVGKIFYERQKT